MIHHRQSLTAKWDEEEIQLQVLLDAGNNDSQAQLLTADRILELAQRLPFLWDRQDNYEKRKLADLIYSNCRLNDRTLCVTYRKPFGIFAEGSQNQN